MVISALLLPPKNRPIWNSSLLGFEYPVLIPMALNRFVVSSSPPSPGVMWWVRALMCSSVMWFTTLLSFCTQMTVDCLTVAESPPP